MCHRVSEGYAHNCRCGYEFGQTVDKAIELLRDQRTNARIGLVVLGSLTLATMALACYLVVELGIVVRSMVPFALLLLATIRTGQKLSLTNTSLRQLGARTLPTARLLK
jgi:hypothetical protein